MTLSAHIICLLIFRIDSASACAPKLEAKTMKMSVSYIRHTNFHITAFFEFNCHVDQNRFKHRSKIHPRSITNAFRNLINKTTECLIDFVISFSSVLFHLGIICAPLGEPFAHFGEPLGKNWSVICPLLGPLWASWGSFGPS